MKKTKLITSACILFTVFERLSKAKNEKGAYSKGQLVVMKRKAQRHPNWTGHSIPSMHVLGL